jgi:hypothetical protein
MRPCGAASERSLGRMHGAIWRPIPRAMPSVPIGPPHVTMSQDVLANSVLGDVVSSVMRIA